MSSGAVGQSRYFLFNFKVEMEKVNFVRVYSKGRQGVNEVVLREVQQVKRPIPVGR
jgi:hypothetical protein